MAMECDNVDVVLSPSLGTNKRPLGITIIAALWTISSMINIFSGLNTIIIDLGYLSYLSDPNVQEWFRFGLPTEIVLGFFIVALSFMILFIVYGLWVAKSWSYHFALAIPVFIMIMNIATLSLYASAPAELGLGEQVSFIVPLLVINLFWTIIIWSYLTRPHVKQYLLGLPPRLTPPTSPPTISPHEVKAAQEEKKFCRYCGAENKTDAKFCEKCGKKIE
jgi:ribosomal protein L40E